MSQNAPEAPPTDTGVDDAPMSALERKDSLEKKLQLRPDAKDLKDRNILWDTKAAPGLQASQRNLERQQHTDSLNKSLKHRPDATDLKARNILPESNAAPALLSHQKDLERHMRKDSLEKHLQARPTAEDLVRDGILEKAEVGSGEAVE